ncbi:nucleotidyltransferase domain-containing protein [Curtobacterium sp. MCBD17_040]|uniref:nucleotidyltransferase domain-containing protein n=1 Tax=Curtobacterium sp. MCBD17_040 TaxID=2175674 RepID=UPI000DAA138B|nr:nucleotidyltransferase domain-containing protein [Curtobacterium sp. MCBD17_040]WIB63675.1 nucleotidyltransferase domain-containing protein [Curtobacterium sp. MCBD17_040]
MSSPQHTLDDDAFLDHVADRLAALPGVEAVALGGSRAQGTNRPDSDWDVAVYHRDAFDPQVVRDLGWPGHLTGLGGWGRIFNGGGAVTVDGRSVDIHYRDLDLIDAVHDDAVRGRFTIEPLLFHQAGLPSTILLAELASNRTLRGQVPRWEYPEALRTAAPGVWWTNADLTLHYAKEGHARHGRVAQCAGLISEAACHAGHAVLARRGEWVTNEKRLLARAGLSGIDDVVAGLGTEVPDLLRGADRARAFLEAAVRREGIGGEPPRAG